MDTLELARKLSKAVGAEFERWDGADGTATFRCTEAFTLRFQDMPKIAEALGTEHIDFGHDPGEDGYHYSSWTYDEGTPGFFFVRARWDVQDA